MTKQLYSPDEIAAHLNLHVKTVRRYIQDGRLKARRIGKEYRVTRADLEAFAGAIVAADPVPRSRHVVASAIVDIDAISPEDSHRITTMLLAGLNARRGEGDFPRLDTIYFPERGALRITITAAPLVTAELLRTVNMLVENRA